MLEKYRQFLGRLESLPITDAVCDHAAALRADSGLLLPDALHLALAELNDCDEFWTADAHFERLAGRINTRIRLVG